MLTCLHDQVNGRVLVPGAAMLEASLAAAFSLADGRQSTPPILTSVSIPAPLILPEPTKRNHSTRLTAVQIAVSTLGGNIQLESAEASSHQQTTHLAGTLAQSSSVPGMTTDRIPHGRATMKRVLPRKLKSSSRSSGVNSASGAMGAVVRGKRSEPSFRCHPAAVDNSMHLAVYVGHADGRTRVPGTCISALGCAS